MLLWPYCIYTIVNFLGNKIIQNGVRLNSVYAYHGIIKKNIVK